MGVPVNLSVCGGKWVHVCACLRECVCVHVTHAMCVCLRVCVRVNLKMCVRIVCVCVHARESMYVWACRREGGREGG